MAGIITKTETRPIPQPHIHAYTNHGKAKTRIKDKHTISAVSLTKANQPRTHQSTADRKNRPSPDRESRACKGCVLTQASRMGAYGVHTLLTEVFAGTGLPIGGGPYIEFPAS